MGFETRIFFQPPPAQPAPGGRPGSPPPLPSLASASVCKAVFGCSDEAAQEAAASLRRDTPEQRTDEYVILMDDADAKSRASNHDQLDGYCVGLKGRGGGGKKVEVKIDVSSTAAPPAPGGGDHPHDDSGAFAVVDVPPLAAWVKHKTKVKHGVDDAKGILEFLQGVASNSATGTISSTRVAWAASIVERHIAERVAAREAAGKKRPMKRKLKGFLPTILVIKSRRCGALSPHFSFEETDVTFALPIQNHEQDSLLPDDDDDDYENENDDRDTGEEDEESGCGGCAPGKAIHLATYRSWAAEAAGANDVLKAVSERWGAAVSGILGPHYTPSSPPSPSRHSTGATEASHSHPSSSALRACHVASYPAMAHIVYSHHQHKKPQQRKGQQKVAPPAAASDLISNAPPSHV